MYEFGIVERSSWIALKAKLAYNSPFTIDTNHLPKNYNNYDISIEYKPLKPKE